MMWWRRNKFYTWCGVTSLTDFRIYLFTWQLTTFTWFSTLCTFDLQFFCMNQVISSYTETTGCNLFYFRVHAIPIRQWFKTCRIFATFTGVRCRAKTIHRNSDCFMRLFTDRTITHSACFETFYDGFFRFNLFNRNTTAYRIVQFHQGTQCYMVIVADSFRVFLIFSIVAVDKGFL